MQVNSHLPSVNRSQSVGGSIRSNTLSANTSGCDVNFRSAQLQQHSIFNFPKAIVRAFKTFFYCCAHLFKKIYNAIVQQRTVVEKEIDDRADQEVKKTYNATVQQRTVVEKEIDDWVDQEIKKNPGCEKDVERAKQELIKVLNARGCVEGNLNLSDCRNLTSLPACIKKISGDLDLKNCLALTSLPAGLQVEGFLSLNGCVSLISLPTNMRVGSMDASFCVSLISIPTDMRVKGCLFLEDCTALTSLPDNLRQVVGGNLHLKRCTALTSLPDNITQLGLCQNGGERTVDLTGCGLSDHKLDALFEAKALGMRIIHSCGPAGRLKLLNSINLWRKEAGSSDADSTTYKNLLSARPDQVSDLCCFLTKAWTTGEYEYAPPVERQLLAIRIVSVLDTMEADEKMMGVLLVMISEAITSCEDRITFALSEIEQKIAMSEAIENLESGRDPEGEGFKKCYKGFWMLGILAEVVRDYSKEYPRSVADELELHLACQFLLKDDLDLPIKIENIKYLDFKTQRNVKMLKGRIIAAATDERFNDDLLAHNVWQRHLRRKKLEGKRYQDIPKATDASLKNLSHECPISRDIADEPVVFRQTLYDLENLKRLYIEGKDIYNREPINLDEVDDIRRITDDQYKEILRLNGITSIQDVNVDSGCAEQL